MKYAEEDPEKPGNVILIYTSESRKYNKSTVNKEHVWPQSRGLSGEAYADPHMLHLADSKEMVHVETTSMEKNRFQMLLCRNG